MSAKTYVIAGIVFIVLGFYFLISADYAVKAIGTDIKNVLAGVCFFGFIASFYLGSRNRKK